MSEQKSTIMSPTSDDALLVELRTLIAMKPVLNANEIVRRREQLAAAKSRVDEILIESLNSGPARRMDRKAWDRVRSQGALIARRSEGT